MFLSALRLKCAGKPIVNLFIKINHTIFAFINHIYANLKQCYGPNLWLWHVMLCHMTVYWGWGAKHGWGVESWPCRTHAGRSLCLVPHWTGWTKHMHSTRWKIRDDCMSFITSKPDFLPICKNKGADQLRTYCKADRHLWFRYTDSTIPLLSKSKISSL